MSPAHEPLLPIIRHLFQAESLEEVSRQRLETFVEEYPFFGIGHYLLSFKLLAGDPERFREATQRTCLYFSNPLWLQWQLENSGADNGRTLAAAAWPLVRTAEESSPGQSGDHVSGSEATAAEQPVEEFSGSGAPPFEQPAEPVFGSGVPAVGQPDEAIAASNEVPSGWSEEEAPAAETTGGRQIPGTAVTGDAHGKEPSAEAQPSEGPSPEAAFAEAQPAEEPTEVPSADVQPSEAQSPEAPPAGAQPTEVPSAGASPSETQSSEPPPVEAKPSEEPAADRLLRSIEEAKSLRESLHKINEDFATETPEPIHDEQTPFVLDEAGQTPEPEVARTAPEVAAAPEPSALTFEPYHTIDYFASQGIRLKPDENPGDKLGKQLKSFTDWLKVMRRLPQKDRETVPDRVAEQAVQNFAAHSIESKDVVTEAMAEVLFKQGMRDRARLIYEKLSLLNPDKRAYFAAKIEQLNIP